MALVVKAARTVSGHSEDRHQRFTRETRETSLAGDTHNGISAMSGDTESQLLGTQRVETVHR